MGNPSSRLIRLMFIPFYLAGIVDSPKAVWTGKSGVVFKIYAFGLCVVSFAGCLRTLHMLLDSNDDPFLEILTPKLAFYCRLIYTMVALKAFGCRVVCFIIFNFGHRKIADAYSEITRDPILRPAVELRVKPFIWLHIAVGFAIIFFFGVNLRVCLTLLSSGKLPDWDSLLILSAAMVAISSIAYGHGFMCLISVMTVCSVLERGRDYFADAVKTQQVDILQRAIELHKKGQAFVAAFNTGFRFLLGISLTAAIPLFSTVCTFLTTSHNHAITEMIVMMYIAVSMSILAVIVSVSVAAKVNNELEMHAEVLRDSDVADEQFEKTANRFLRRFNKRPGFTFFGFGTVTRETLLTAFGLMTNYYIVGIQLDSL